MTLVSSNGNAASFGGATETAFSTPSGGNQLHGEAFWYNRNNAFSANDWFNNQSGIDRPFLNQNQFGGSLGGPIRSDKAVLLLQLRGRSRAPAGARPPRPSSRSRRAAGIFTYNDTAGVQHSVNLLALRGLTGVDPAIQPILNQVPGPQFINSNTASGDGLNTGGYRFNQRDNETRDNVTGKLDYNLSTKHALAARTPGIATIRTARTPKTTTRSFPRSSTRPMPSCWRSRGAGRPPPRLTNEVRGRLQSDRRLLQLLASNSARTC